MLALLILVGRGGRAEDDWGWGDELGGAGDEDGAELDVLLGFAACP